MTHVGRRLLALVLLLLAGLAFAGAGIADGPRAAPSLLAPDGGPGGPPRTALLFEKARFRGRTLAVRGPVPDLAKLRFDNKASSAQLEGRWLLCSLPNYRGRCRIVSGEVESLARLDLRNSLSSLRPER